jgi:two-component system response regulator MprA
VLIVEDDAPAARVLARLLREDGYETETVFDGAAAIARLTRTPRPAVLIVDYRLPHADGIAVATYARAVDPNVAVFFVTGYGEAVGKRIGETFADSPVLGKPVSYDDLRARIASMAPAPVPAIG